MRKTDPAYAGSFAGGEYTFSYAENTDAGIPIGKVLATDADVNDTLTYSIANNVLVDDGNGTQVAAYQIDAGGFISLTNAGQNALTNDFETLNNLHQITVEVSDGNGPNTAVTVNLNETNLDDNNPVFAQDPDPAYAGSFAGGEYTFSYAENTDAGIPIGKVLATDADVNDTLTYSIANNVLVDDGNGTQVAAYQIDAGGFISLTNAGQNALTNDFETLNNLHQITVEVSDGNGPNTAVTVNLNETNLDDNNPVLRKILILLTQAPSQAANTPSPTQKTPTLAFRSARS